MTVIKSIHKKIADQLIQHEDLRLKPYRCPAGKLTIGIGRNLEDKGITQKEAIMLLKNDIQDCISDLKEIFSDQKNNENEKNEFDSLPEGVQIVLVDMRFNLGHDGFRRFKKMIKAVREHDFHRAALEMKDSRWYYQVGKRAENLVKMMKNSATSTTGMNRIRKLANGEDIEDLAALAERKNEVTIPHEKFINELKNDGII
nr:glycoside hydrolase family protein [Desulfobacula toluolica]